MRTNSNNSINFAILGYFWNVLLLVQVKKTVLIAIGFKFLQTLEQNEYLYITIIILNETPNKKYYNKRWVKSVKCFRLYSSWVIVILISLYHSIDNQKLIKICRKFKIIVNIRHGCSTNKTELLCAICRTSDNVTTQALSD